MLLNILTKKYILKLFVIFLWFFLSIIAISNLHARQDQLISAPIDGEVPIIQNELNSQAAKKAIISFENSGLASLGSEDLSLTLLSYSYGNIGEKGKPLPFVIAKCSINTEKFDKWAAEIRKTDPHALIFFPRAEQTVVGVVDVENHRFFPMDILERSKPKIKFEKLVKDAPDHIILTYEGEKIAPCNGCEAVVDADVWIWGFDGTDKTFRKVLTVKPYEFVALSGVEGDLAYVKIYTYVLSDWIRDAYREIIVTTKRKIISRDRNRPRETEDDFTERREVHSWNEKKELYLAERIDDGKTVLHRSDGPRFYSLQQVQKEIAKQPSAVAVLKLVEFVGDPSPVIAYEAKKEFWRYARKRGNERLDKSIVRALVQKILKGTHKEIADASAILPQDEILTLDSTDKISLIESVNSDYDNTLLIGLSLTGAGGDKILPFLMKKLEKAQAGRHGCDVSEILTGINAIAKQKVEFSGKQVAILQDVKKSKLTCGLNDTADDANEVLKLLQVKR